MTRADGNPRRRRIVPGILAAGVAGAIAATASADPRTDYLLHCAGCHLTDARGVPGSVPSLAGPLGRIASSPEGRDYLARVPGASQAPISDEALAAVFNWLLLEFNRDTLPRGFQPLRSSEIARSRARVLADPLKLRNELWPEAAPY
jgi:mono/diheme cytochrome c family protein